MFENVEGSELLDLLFNAFNEYDIDLSNIEMKVVNNNPGAIRALTDIRTLPDYEKILNWCLDNNIIGSNLYIIWNDEFNQDVRPFWDYLNIKVEKNEQFNISDMHEERCIRELQNV